ncbi:hypothetical protein KJ039_07255 [bacterium]|nr:hypothetical protein [bacterium]
MSFNKSIFLYKNLLKLHAPTVSSEDSDYPKTNLYDGDRNSFFKPEDSSDLTITIDAGADKPVDMLCLGNLHNLATAGATIALEWCPNDSWGGDRETVFSEAISTDNAYYHKLFTQLSKRHWRIKLSGMSAIPQIGELAFGARFTLPHYFGDGHDRERHIEGKTNVADGGPKEDIVFHRRNIFPCTLADVRALSQAETDILAWRDAVEDGTPFWFLRDASGSYVLYFVALAERVHKSPISAIGKRTFSFTLEEEL